MTDTEIPQKLLVLVAILVASSFLQNLIQLALLLRSGSTAKKKQQGLSCAHCCSALNAENPANGYALPDSTLLVYNCPSCGRETAIRSTV